MPQCRHSGCLGAPGSGVGSAPSTVLLMPSAHTAPTTARPAQISRADRQLAVSATGLAYPAPDSPTTAGSTATASRLPVRATALFTPDATPANRSGAAASTVAVTGATIADRPRPNTSTPGSTPVTYCAPGRTMRNSSMPAATSIGPATNCVLGPIRCASLPDRADSNSISTVIGRPASPARVGG